MVQIEPFMPAAPTADAESQVDGIGAMGMVRLAKNAMNAIEKVGISATEFGATRFADGCAAITASSLVKLLEKLSEKLDGELDKDDLQQLAQSMTLVAKSMVGLTGVIKGRGPILNNRPPAQFSFPAHAKVTFVNNQTVVQPS